MIDQERIKQDLAKLREKVAKAADALHLPMLEEELKKSGIIYAIFRPTGYFYDIAKVFKPMIARRSPPLPSRKYPFIGGSSMGGLMSLYAIMRYNWVFSRAAALSPSLWFAPQQLERMLSRARIGRDTVVYMDYGSNEFSRHENMAQQFGLTAARLMEMGILLDCRIVPGGEHCEASWEQQIPFFMNTLLYGVE